ncbi:acyltransferase [Aliiglaciecola sp. LCG003]|uniref:acyltransferase n=1 Tax=Aliiglaciecola sp. LCG003 TaxID=3053655 RepID=UPI0025746B66|nr:acyltransferase [Aliiglaciecola sp. LCG003]WJG10401.1 acyltransferase [Aliiglaciecola sp. LCG003]
MRYIKRYLLAFICFLKYRKLRFGAVGTNTQFKSLKSNFSYPQNIFLGDDVNIGPGADFDGAGNIVIGKGVITAPGVIIYSRTHYFDGPTLGALPFDNKMICAEVKINEYVWIGRNVIILPGVEIGEGAVIGAGSIVSKSIPAGAIAVGNPAKPVKFRDAEKYEELKAQDKFVYRTFAHSKIFVTKDNA